MNCTRCRKSYAQESTRCPYCGESNPQASGVMQTSIVMIASGGEHLVFRTVQEVPARLRGKLLRSTNGSNSATILIADRRGRKQVAKALRALPGPSQRRLMHNALHRASSPLAAWFTPTRRRAAIAFLILMAILIIAAVFRLRA